MLDPEIVQNDLSAKGGSERNSSKANKDLELNSGLDSGFLSGPQANYSTDFENSFSFDDSDANNINRSLPKETQQKTDTYIDSGAIEDHEPDSSFQSATASKQNSHMIISSGVDVGLPDWFSNLSLKDSPLVNNLDAKTEKSTSSHEQQIQKKSKDIQTNLWKLCYRQDEDGDTQLHIAIISEYANPHIIWAIIRLAPAPWLLDTKNDIAQAPIHLAVITGQSNIVRRLLIAGAKASIRDSEGNTPLHLACFNGDLSSVEALLTPITVTEIQEVYKFSSQSSQSYPHRHHPADLEQRNFYGESCVHIAAQKNRIEILRQLIWSGADINAREGRAGFTPLHLAVERNNEELVKFLLEEAKQLNIEALSYGQITAYQLACVLEHTSLIAILENFGCEPLSPPESDYDDSDASDNFDSDN